MLYGAWQNPNIIYKIQIVHAMCKIIRRTLFILFWFYSNGLLLLFCVFYFISHLAGSIGLFKVQQKWRNKKSTTTSANLIVHLPHAVFLFLIFSQSPLSIYIYYFFFFCVSCYYSKYENCDYKIARVEFILLTKRVVVLET